MAVAWGTPMPRTPRVVQACPGHPDEHADGPRTHQVQGRLVGRATPDDDWDLELADETLEIKRFDGLGNVLGGDHRALYDEQVELGIDKGFGVLRRALGGQRPARHDPCRLDLPDPGGDELGPDGFGVNLLHTYRGLVRAQLGDFLEVGLGVLIARPQTLEVEHAHAAQPTDLDSRGGADHAVHGRSHQWELEAEGIDFPGNIDIFGVSRTPARDDGDVVEAVCPPPRLTFADLDFHVACLSRASLWSGPSLCPTSPGGRQARPDKLGQTSSGARQAQAPDKLRRQTDRWPSVPGAHLWRSPSGRPTPQGARAGP